MAPAIDNRVQQATQLLLAQEFAANVARTIYMQAHNHQPAQRAVPRRIQVERIPQNLLAPHALSASLDMHVMARVSKLPAKRALLPLLERESVQLAEKMTCSVKMQHQYARLVVCHRILPDRAQ